MRRRAVPLRFDTILVTIITILLVYNFGWQMADKENLLATGMLILTIFVNGVLVLLNFWSVQAHQFYAYAQLRPDQIE